MNPNVQESVAQEVNNRLAKATEELKAKYEAGIVSEETSVTAPTGEAYKQKYEEEQKRRKEMKEAYKDHENRLENKTINNQSKGENDDSDSDDDDDNDLRLIRENRLKQLKLQQNQKLENISKGHGQYREITQDEFLPEVTGSQKVIVHFYHTDFPRCVIMDHHLQKLAPQHVEAKMVKINAAKAPFFVEKLIIRTMPTVVIFDDGKAIDKIIGFEGLADNQPEGKEDEWSTATLAYLLAGKGAINPKNIIDEAAKEKAAEDKFRQMREAYIKEGLNNYDLSDDDFSD